MMKRDNSKLLKMTFCALAILVAVLCSCTDKTYASGKSDPGALKEKNEKTERTAEDYKDMLVVLCSKADSGDASVPEKVEALRKYFEGLEAEVITVEVEHDDNGDAEVNVTGDIKSLIKSLGNGNEMQGLWAKIVEKGFSNVEIVVIDEHTHVEDYYVEGSAAAEDSDKTADKDGEESEIKEDNEQDAADGLEKEDEIEGEDKAAEEDNKEDTAKEDAAEEEKSAEEENKEEIKEEGEQETEETAETADRRTS